MTAELITSQFPPPDWYYHLMSPPPVSVAIDKVREDMLRSLTKVSAELQKLPPTGADAQVSAMVQTLTKLSNQLLQPMTQEQLDSLATDYTTTQNVLLTQCNSIVQSVTSQTGTASSSGSMMSLWKLAPGDCFDVVPGSGQEPHIAIRLPCAEPHSLELMAFLVVPAVQGAPWPGDPAVGQFADPACSSAFVDYVGLPDAESIYNYAYLPMTEPAWNAGERRIPCSVGSDDGRGKIRGSVKGFSR